MNRQREREDFLLAMAREGVPAGVARLVMRHATSLHRLAELQCSSEAYDRDQVACPGDYAEGDCLCRDYGNWENGHGRVPRGNVTERRLHGRIEALLAPFQVVAVFQGDPRGAVVKLQVPSGRTDDWGRVGLCVP